MSKMSNRLGKLGSSVQVVVPDILPKLYDTKGDVDHDSAIFGRAFGSDFLAHCHYIQIVIIGN